MHSGIGIGVRDHLQPICTQFVVAMSLDGLLLPKGNTDQPSCRQFEFLARQPRRHLAKKNLTLNRVCWNVLVLSPWPVFNRREPMLIVLPFFALVHCPRPFVMLLV